MVSGLGLSIHYSSLNYKNETLQKVIVVFSISFCSEKVIKSSQCSLPFSYRILAIIIRTGIEPAKKGLIKKRCASRATSGAISKFLLQDTTRNEGEGH